MIHIVRVWMDNKSNFIISDDDDYVARKKREWMDGGGHVLSDRIIHEPEMGLIFYRRKEDNPTGADPLPEE